MSNVYIITSGEYSEYSITSVWSSKEEAEKLCVLLNTGKNYEEYRVEEFPLDAPAPLDTNYFLMGYRAVYDYSVHGLQLDSSNIVFKDAAFYRGENNWVIDTGSEMRVLGESKEKCLRMFSDRLAEKKAEEAGIIW